MLCHLFKLFQFLNVNSKIWVGNTYDVGTKHGYKKVVKYSSIFNLNF